jgi:hypothetical protein
MSFTGILGEETGTFNIILAQAGILSLGAGLTRTCVPLTKREQFIHIH